MEKEAYLTVLRADATALATGARLGLARPVPSGPGWSVADLVTHTGAVHRSQTSLVSTRAQEPSGFKREMFASAPGLLEWFERSVFFGGETDLDAIPPALIPWFEEGAALLIEALQTADPDEPVWSWSGNNRVAHYLRMMPIETAVHRWDAQSAVDRAESIDRDLAVDGISQTLEVMLPFRRAQSQPPAGTGESYSLVQTDGPHAWYVRFDEESVQIEYEECDSGVRIEGTASDLFLFLWQRLPAESLDMQGDAKLLTRYFKLVPPV